MASPKRILLIEDETHIAEGLRLNLTLQGYQVHIAHDGVTGLAAWKSFQPDLIVLDIMLPSIDGLSVLRNIRLEDERLPILILSARSETDDRVKGLKFGSDDYLAKPFDLEEFLLRVNRLLTREDWIRQAEHHMQADNEDALKDAFSFGDNTIDFNTAVARCEQGEIQLTGQEIKLLKLFISNRGKALSRSKLLEIGWGYTKGMTTRTVDNFIVRFRKYFERNPKKPEFFISRRSVGYIFNDKGQPGEGAAESSKS